MVLGRVPGLVADLLAGVFHVAVAPLVIGYGVKDIVAQAGGRHNTAFDHLGNIALAAPDRKLACIAGLIFLVDTADAQANDGKVKGVGKMTPKRFEPDLAAPIKTGGTHRGFVG